MSWCIEQAKTARSSCRQCHKAIARGEHRFGNGSEWFHLTCAPVGRPREFKPFAKQAAILAKPPELEVNNPRNPVLEARLVANPDDVQVRTEYAEWLQRQGHPLGKIIALELAGKSAAATKLFDSQRMTLTGGLSPKLFEWDRFFIRRVKLEAGQSEPTKMPPQLATLLQVLSLPTGLLVREIAIPARLDASVVAALGEKIPPTVTKLFMWFTNAAAALALPHLTRLELFAFRDIELDPTKLPPLFAGERLPKLTRLHLYGPLSAPLVTALLDSQLVQRLTWLELSQGALDPVGVELVIARANVLAHIPVVRIVGAEAAFPAQHQAWLDRSQTDP